VTEYERLLAMVQSEHPHAPQLYSAQIRLARYTRDVLGEPRRAAVRLERLLTDLDLPTEGVALARLTLGECYLADGDTARGRLVLTNLGKDPDFRAASGHAHYHLARLDFAEEHFVTARERFAAVAIDAPAAPYANDALELGLAIAEELENPTGGPPVLALYARAVYFELTAQPDSQIAAYERFVDEAPRYLDLEAPQHLLERARFELALLYLKAGRTDEALAQLARVVSDHPAGRFPAQALERRGQVLAELGDTAGAREAYERLLLQYPDYLFGDDVRDSVRSLP
jgi:tetratricopeptide (TPR) repeat protein